MSSGWIGVDFDGTLCTYEPWNWEGSEVIKGKPILNMVERVKRWLNEGYDVRILTARVSDPRGPELAERVIKDWCVVHLGQSLEVTCCKDYEMIEMWDDRAMSVRTNTGLASGVSELEGTLYDE